MAKSKTKKKSKTRPVPGKEARRLPSPGEEIYSNNMQALRRYYPELARAVSRSNSERFQLEWNGQPPVPNLWDKGRGQYYYSSGNPMEEVRREMVELKLKNARMVIFLGLGLGFELHHYLKCYARENTTFFLVIEKELEIFKAALHVINMVGAISDPNFKFVVGEDSEKLYPLFRACLKEKMLFYLLKALRPVYHSSALLVNRDYYMSALQSLRDAGVHEVLNYGNDPYDSLLGVENMLGNLKEIICHPGINMLYERFRGRPAVVVATGPSLNKNKHLLKELEDKALLIAADASLKIMLEMGVKPHLVSSLERWPDTAELLKGFTAEQLDGVYLAACPVVSPVCYDVYPGPRIIVYRNFDHFRWLGIDKGILDIKLSSGNMAFKIATALGCDPIILIGQDLAFSRDGRTHAAGAVTGEHLEAAYRDRSLEVMGNDGQPILTCQGWYSFLKAYEVDLSEYEGTCINSTEGGAYISGTEVMPFKEAIARYITEPFQPLQVIREALAAFNPSQIEQDMKQVFRLLEATYADMQQIVEYCREGIESCEKYGAELRRIIFNHQTGLDIQQRLSVIENDILTPRQKCIKMHRTFQLFFAHIFQSYSIKFEMDNIEAMEKFNDQLLGRAQILLRYIEWYAVIGDLAGICMSSLQNSRAGLKELLVQEDMRTAKGCLL